MDNNFSVKAQCREILDSWVGSCREDCDDCEHGPGGTDNCYLMFCSFLEMIETADMKKKLEYQRARHYKGKDHRMILKREERDVVAWCSSCKYSETVSLINEKLVPTKKFLQDAEGAIYHKCSKDKFGECELR